MKKLRNICFFAAVLTFTSRWTGITFGYKGRAGAPTEFWIFFLIAGIVLTIIMEIIKKKTGDDDYFDY